MTGHSRRKFGHIAHQSEAKERIAYEKDDFCYGQ